MLYPLSYGGGTNKLPAQQFTPGGLCPGVMPMTVVVGPGGVVVGAPLASGAVVDVVVSTGRGVCITVVKSAPVTSTTWLAASDGSTSWRAPDVRCRASRSAAASDPGA